jgi:multiple sugar transport system substrate-binding protein
MPPLLIIKALSFRALFVALEARDSHRNQSLAERKKLMKLVAGRLLLAATALLAVSVAAAQTTVTFWSHTHPPMVTLNEKLVEEFEAQNPGIDIEYEVIPNNQFFEKMLISMSTGVGPDVINMGNTQLISDYIPRGLVDELDYEAMGYGSLEELKAEYVPAGLEGAQANGKYYGRPSEFNTDMLVIHVPDLEEAGIDADWAPATWEELGEVAAQLSKFDDSGRQTHRGFDLVYLHSGWYANQFHTLAEQTGCELYNADNSESTANSSECIRAASIWQDMIYEYHAANPRLTSGESTVPLQDYIDGTVSMTFIQPWGMELVRGANPERWENSKLVPLPQVDRANPTTKVNGYYWAVNSQSEVKDAAWKFIDFLASHPGRWLVEVNFLQANTNMAELPEAAGFPYAEQWLTALEAGQFTRTYPNANETNEALQSALEAILLNEADVEQAMTTLKRDLDRVVR